MSSSVTFSICSPSKTPLPLHHGFNFSFFANPFFLRRRNPRPFSVKASLAGKNATREFSWTAWNKVTSDEYNGWAIEESDQRPVMKKSLPIFAVTTTGASVVGLIGLLVYSSLSSKGFGFRVRSPFHALHGHKLSSLSSKNDYTNEEVIDVTLGDAEVTEQYLDCASVTEEASDTIRERKAERIVVPFTVDSAQQDALFVLKKLKIMEDDVRADELCTRREYARWLMRANSQLERNRKHQIVSSAALSGSSIYSFDDVSVQDPDFVYIQSLAEAGIVESKLSNGIYGSTLNNAEGEVRANFLPERYISRQDLVSWKAKTEYEVMPGISEEMSRKNIGFLDVKQISSDAVVELFMDIMANEKSILRGVFGQSKRLQPSKPCTKGQAAVALICGRLAELVRAEISRLEAENVSRQYEMEEIMYELLERGEIKQYWERKMEEERRRGMEVELDHRTSITALEQEKTFQEISLAELLKQQAALDCQKRLLSTLDSEVTNMSEKLTLDRVKHIDEQHSIQNVRHDLEMKCEGLLDTKSILEAELEALRILRSWIEDEARKCQARAKVLEEAGRRWRWDNQS